MKGQTALYRIFDAGDVLLYIGIAKTFGARWHQHAREKPWWPEVHHQTITWYPTRQEADDAETAAIKAEKPKYNIAKAPWNADPAIVQVLAEAQAGMAAWTAAILRRRRAVMAARAAGWTKYKIAATLGVRGPTVDSIIASAERAEQ